MEAELSRQIGHGVAVGAIAVLQRHVQDVREALMPLGWLKVGLASLMAATIT